MKIQIGRFTHKGIPTFRKQNTKYIKETYCQNTITVHGRAQLHNTFLKKVYKHCLLSYIHDFFIGHPPKPIYISPVNTLIPFIYIICFSNVSQANRFAKHRLLFIPNLSYGRRKDSFIMSSAFPYR